MSGYCKDCGNQHCICDSIEKNIFESICNILGWQGGTIHQVYDEIKRLKQKEKDLQEFKNIVINEKSICIPAIQYKLKDCLDDKCLNCNNNIICNFLVEKELL